jgi:hypothetical protein
VSGSRCGTGVQTPALPKKEDPRICYRQKQTLSPPKQAGGVAILLSDKVHFKPKLFRRDKEGHFIVIKGSIKQEEITIINLNAHNVSPPKSIKHILLYIKTQIDPNTVVMGDFNMPLPPIDMSSR